MDILYIIMPAYNESKNIRKVIKEWYPIVEKNNGDGRSRLVVIDDGSKDDTCRIVQEEAKKRPLLRLLVKENGGHGDTVLYGYQYAVSAGADYIFQTDSDGQTCPGEFAAFWERRREYDAIIGYRNHREDGYLRIFVTKVLRLVVRLYLGERVTDANTPFRLMERESLIRYLALIPEHFNLPNVVLSAAYVRFDKEHVKFIPITFRKRQGGVNSINLKKIAKIGKQATVDFRKIRREMDAFTHRER